jgi:hypothetical protein
MLKAHPVKIGQRIELTAVLTNRAKEASYLRFAKKKLPMSGLALSAVSKVTNFHENFIHYILLTFNGEWFNNRGE